MKTIGLIGGMSWESSAEYYRIVNRLVQQKLGKAHSCECLMYSVDFEEIKRLQHEEKWDVLSEKLVEIAQKLERAGAELIVVCTNTMHLVADEISVNIRIPLLHIADATGLAIKEKQISNVGLLGTRFTMEKEFLKNKLETDYELKVLVPDLAEREIVHRIIYEELIKGVIRKDSKREYLQIIENLKEKGAEGIILGCTEIPLLVKQEDVAIPLFDTTFLHAEYAVCEALK